MTKKKDKNLHWATETQTMTARSSITFMMQDIVGFFGRDDSGARKNLVLCGKEEV